jgi:2-methylisocitrate lyase-like PEP mutase family enzyme
MPTQKERVARFRALHERAGAFVIPNPWDAGSARMLAHLGFEALATTSAGHAWTRGLPDGGQEREPVLAHCREIVAATGLPVNADLEKCFADEPAGVAETIRLAAATGLAGASIEDSTGDAAQPLFPFDLAIARVKAGVVANRAAPVPMLITARAEGLLHGQKDLDEIIRRLQAYEAAGADVLYAPGLATMDAVRRVVGAVRKPVNVLVSRYNATMTVAELSAAGAKRISVGGTLARAAWGGFLNAAREIKETGTFAFDKAAASSAELNGAFKRWETP